MSETSALYTVAAVAVVTWIAVFGYLVHVDTTVKRLESRLNSQRGSCEGSTSPDRSAEARGTRDTGRSSKR
ncbi:MAG: CcmD family protein [Clostridia bacterium]|nr:CcmD family protein [Clostridia bacterium]